MSSNEIRIHKTLARCGILAVVLLATLCRCARQAAPQGGPRDSLPPKVVTMTPAFGTTHFKDKRILIEFDEYVQLEDQQKEFFTSPFMEQKPVLSIRGRSVQIDLKEDLDSNRTYALDFGSSVVDNNEGNPYVGLRYVFSTGGEIDSLLMSGYTVDAQKGDTLGKVFLLFFDAKADSIPAYDSTIVNSKPLSVARSYPNGIFIAENLKPTDYRIYALEDNNNNMRYEPGVDRVAFLDTVFNPLREPAFDIWYDTSRRYMQADPQLMMRLFKEIPSKRQTYTGASRPQSNRVTLMFSAPFPQIDTLVFEGFDPSKILTEYVTPRRDTMTLWFDAIEEEMPDTLRGRLVYRKHDSTGVLQSAGQDLAIAWRRPAKKEKEKEKEKKDDAPEPNPFKVKVAGGTTLNPEKNIVFDFDYPLTRVDSTAIDLQRLGEGESSEPVKVSFVQDTAKLRSWTLSAPWVAGEKYRLTIPAGTFANTNRESNDTLRSEFTIESPEKYGHADPQREGQNAAERIRHRGTARRPGAEGDSPCPQRDPHDPLRGRRNDQTPVHRGPERKREMGYGFRIRKAAARAGRVLRRQVRHRRDRDQGKLGSRVRRRHERAVRPDHDGTDAGKDTPRRTGAPARDSQETGGAGEERPPVLRRRRQQK